MRLLIMRARARRIGYSGSNSFAHVLARMIQLRKKLSGVFARRVGAARSHASSSEHVGNIRCYQMLYLAERTTRRFIWRSKMKTMITAVVLVLIAAGPTFAASSLTRHVQNGAPALPFRVRASLAAPTQAVKIWFAPWETDLLSPVRLSDRFLHPHTIAAGGSRRVFPARRLHQAAYRLSGSPEEGDHDALTLY